MKRAVTQQFVTSLYENVTSRKANYKATLSDYAQSTVSEKIAKYQHEKDDSSGNRMLFASAVRNRVEISDLLKESERLSRIAQHELDSVKDNLKRRELDTGNRILSLQSKLAECKSAFNSKMASFVSGRKSARTSMLIRSIMKRAVGYYKAARLQLGNYQTLESVVTSLLYFNATDASGLVKLQQTIANVGTSRRDIKDAKRGLIKLAKFAKSKCFDVDLSCLDDDKVSRLVDGNCSDDESNSECESDSEQHKIHGYESVTETDRDGSDPNSDSGSEDSDDDDDATGGSSSDASHTSAIRNRRHASCGDNTPIPTLTDYLTNNPYDFFAKFIKPRMPESHVQNPFDLLAMITKPNALDHAKLSKKLRKHHKTRIPKTVRRARVRD
jgi:hypothetical protein